MSENGNGASGNPASVRYHGLDALRAWAMSMGIVLHAAWIMIPGEAGAPMTDASASSVTDFVCLAIHTFRMQLFFVLAGLFACLLLHKRGLAKFALNRTQRILLPLVVFWLILCPIIMWQYNVGGLASGAIQSDKSAWELTGEYFANINPDNVMLLHLWFLYYLCWVYVLVFAARGVAAIVDRNRSIRDWISGKFGTLASTHWSVLILAALFAPLMMPMKGSWGVDIGLASLYPKWPGLLTYVAYFVCGWLIFRNIGKLGLMVRGWRWQLAVGLLLIVPYFFYSKYVSQHGYATWNYPQLVIEDFRFEDGHPAYAEFRDKLMTSPPDSIPGTLWQLIPEENREFVEQHDSVSDNQLNGLLVAVNTTVLSEAEFTERIDADPVKLSGEPQSICRLPSADRTAEQNQLLNRELLNIGFAGTIYSEDVHRPLYYPIRAAYCYVYSLITWLLVFGCIGFSQHHFDRDSRFWRYFSDSSYWFYLAHLPIQFQILLWIGDKPWNPLLKFTVYVVGTIAVLLPSYHFLVRPTWIGWFLNGRMASVWKQPAGVLQSESQAMSDAVGREDGMAKRSNGASQQVLGRTDDAAPTIPRPHVEANGSPDRRVVH